MASGEEMTVVVLVKASPVMTSDLEETMCVAAVRVDGGRNEWLRLHPVPFRDLAHENRFKKYQHVTVRAIRPNRDRRPETWTPLDGSIIPGPVLGTERGWSTRRPLIERLGEYTMCELVAANERGSGPGVPSLGVVRPREPPRLQISLRDKEQLRTWKKRAEASANRPSLFDDPDVTKLPLQIVPWRFRYKYHCQSPDCRNGHEQTIVDWEIAQLWQRNQYKPDWQEQMRKRLEDDMWNGRDSVLFVGNQEQHPGSFLVLGVFWPPAMPVQGVLAI